MPFQSQAQARFLWAKHPDIAQKWSDEGYTQKGLPMHAHSGGDHLKKVKRQAYLEQLSGKQTS